MKIKPLLLLTVLSLLTISGVAQRKDLDFSFIDRYLGNTINFDTLNYKQFGKESFFSGESTLESESKPNNYLTVVIYPKQNYESLTKSLNKIIAVIKRTESYRSISPDIERIDKHYLYERKNGEAIIEHVIIKLLDNELPVVSVVGNELYFKTPGAVR